MEFADLVAQWLAVTFTEEYDFDGGTLRIGLSTDRPVPYCLGGWFGESHTLKAAVKAITPPQMLEIFGQIEVHELDDGIQLSVRADSAPHSL